VTSESPFPLQTMSSNLSTRPAKKDSLTVGLPGMLVAMRVLRSCN
jgi:hypothetical protein